MVGRVAPFLAVCAVLAGQLGGAEFQFGRAAVRITPTAETGGVKQVLDDLYAKAVVFEKDGTTVAMVVCDLPVMNRPVADAARRLIEAETAIPAAHVMISATHTHTGLVPAWGGSTPFPELAPVMEGKEADEARRYTRFLTQAIAEAVSQAHRDRRPARVSAAIGREDSLPFNRRFLMKDGSVVFNPGVQNPNIVRPAGPVDPDVPVVCFETPEEAPLATLVNYAMHLDTVGVDAYSADYPFTLATLLAAAKGPDMLTVFSIGTAGNVNHLDVRRPRPPRGPQEPARIGTVLAAEVLRTYSKLQPLEVRRVQATSESVPLPPVELRPGDSDRAHQLIRREQSGGAPLNLLERVFVQRVLFAERQQGKAYEVEVLAIALGDDLAWVGLPGEVFVELGLAIKKGSPFRYTVINTLTADWIRYVPNRKGFQEGAYEAINTRCGPGGGEMFVDAALRCLLRLRAAPQPPGGQESARLLSELKSRLKLVEPVQ
jgi:neutral ceramidase